MSSLFRLTRAIVLVDRVVVLNEKATPKGSLPFEIALHAGTLAFGHHTIRVLILLRGHGDGYLSYLSGYEFEVKWSHRFTLAEDRTLGIEITAYEKDQASFVQRPGIRYVEISVRRPMQPVKPPETDAASAAVSQPTDESTSPAAVPAERARPTDRPP